MIVPDILIKSVKDHRLSTIVLILVLALAVLVPRISLAAGWTPTAPMGTARSFFTATLLPNGKVLVAGGAGSGGASLSSCELYDPAANDGAGAWSPTASLAASPKATRPPCCPTARSWWLGGYGGAFLPSCELL